MTISQMEKRNDLGMTGRVALLSCLQQRWRNAFLVHKYSVVVMA